MYCPIVTQLQVGDKCQIATCPYHSKRQTEGCFFGQLKTPAVLAWHKRLTVAEVEDYLKITEQEVMRYLKLWRYAQFVEPIEPSAEILIEFDKTMQQMPYRLTPFRFMTAGHWARMKQKEAFTSFKATGIEVSGSLQRFLYGKRKKESKS